MASPTSGEAGRLSLLALQSRMKCDPQGYEEELLLQLRHFEACLSVFQLHSSISLSSSFSSDQNAAKELAEMTMFLAHVAPVYRQHLGHFPQQILGLLKSRGDLLPPELRRQLTQALILLRNRQMIELVEILPVLMELQILGDRTLRKLASLHVVQDIRRMNLKHRNESKTRALQNVLFQMLQDGNEAKSKRALIVLCDLYRRKLWVDDRTANAICAACLHKSVKILKATLLFLLGYEKVDEEDDGTSEDEDQDHKPSVAVSREAIYKAHHKGTVSSRKKKQAKLQRVIRSLKKQRRTEVEGTDWTASPLQHLYDPQEFAEKLFSRLHTCNERFEVKLMMMRVISRSVGLHRLILLNFYPFLQKYIEPHQHDVTHILSAAVQACHDMVPPDAVESLLRQLVNKFVHDRARSEVIAVGLNTVREICMRMPLIMTQDLLHDLAMYKKSREKAVASAARSIISIYRQVFPSLLEKKDRGRGADLSVKPKAFGEKLVQSCVPGIELLANDKGESESDIDELVNSDDDVEHLPADEVREDMSSEEEEDNDLKVQDPDEAECTDDESESESNKEDLSDKEDRLDSSDDEEDLSSMEDATDSDGEEQPMNWENESEHNKDHMINVESSIKKRKFNEHVYSRNMQCSLRQLKKLATAQSSSHCEVAVMTTAGEDRDGILSNEDFDRIKKLQARKAAQAALAQHGISKGVTNKEVGTKLPSSEDIHERRVNPASLEPKIHRRHEKEERIASVRAGREDRLPYSSRTAVKLKKTGGLSNRQREKRKDMPLAAKRAKAAKSRNKKKAKKFSGKQFRGRKAWKQ